MNSTNDEESTAPAPATSSRDEKVALLAYKFWVERGAPIGSPEVDWFRAEEEMTVLTDAEPEFPANEGRVASARSDL